VFSPIPFKSLGARDVSGQRSRDLRFHATHAGIDCETEVGIPQKRQAIGSRNSLFNFIQEHVVVYPSITHASEINSPRRARERGAEEYDAVVYTHISVDRTKVLLRREGERDLVQAQGAWARCEDRLYSSPVGRQ